MPRTRLYASDSERHASYRERLASDRDAVKSMRESAETKSPPERLSDSSKKWFRVEVLIDRPDDLPQPVTARYVMEESHLQRFHADLHAFKTKSPDAPRIGVYAFGGSGDDDFTPGTITLRLYGFSIISQNPMPPDYAPMDCYSISDTAAMLIRREYRAASL